MSDNSNGEQDAILAIDQLVAGYGKSEVLLGIDLVIKRGEIVTMVGANGAGKLTTLRSIFGLTDVRAGRIHFKGKDITGRKSHRIVPLGLAFVPQERNVFPSLSVYENLEMGAYTLPRQRILENMDAVFGYFPILKERREQKAGTLSGGERQMLAIGRGLMTNPDLLMLDEPSLGLAPLVVDAVFEEIMRIHERGTTVFLVEQNARRALSVADRAYVLELGQIRHEGSGQALLDNPDVQRAYLGN